MTPEERNDWTPAYPWLAPGWTAVHRTKAESMTELIQTVITPYTTLQTLLYKACKALDARDEMLDAVAEGVAKFKTSTVADRLWCEFTVKKIRALLGES